MFFPHWRVTHHHVEGTGHRGTEKWLTRSQMDHDSLQRRSPIKAPPLLLKSGNCTQKSPKTRVFAMTAVTSVTTLALIMHNLMTCLIWEWSVKWECVDCESTDSTSVTVCAFSKAFVAEPALNTVNAIYNEICAKWNKICMQFVTHLSRWCVAPLLSSRLSYSPNRNRTDGRRGQEGVCLVLGDLLQGKK